MSTARLSRVLRAIGDQQASRHLAEQARAWYTAGGGGEGLLLAEYVLAALDADDDRPTADQLLSVVLAHARDARDGEVELRTLDALARLDARNGRTSQAQSALAAAATLMATVGHLVTDGDRTDADTAPPPSLSRRWSLLPPPPGIADPKSALHRGR